MKNQRGITLIALVITIIVLLILAGVSISMALGENGILTRAENAVERHGEAEQDEKETFQNVAEFMDKYGTDTSEQAGLYDANGVMLASWEELESYGFDIEAEVVMGSNYVPPTVLYSILTGEHAEELQNGTRLVIPNTVTSIGIGAFVQCTELTNIKIPDSVTSIGDGAFFLCTGLTNIEIPESVTSIGGGAFFGCTNLTEITIPDSVTSIGYCAFQGCENITEITIPDGVTSIGEQAFSGWTSDQTINIKTHASAPSTWDSSWNSDCSATINWAQ